MIILNGRILLIITVLGSLTYSCACTHYILAQVHNVRTVYMHEYTPLLGVLLMQCILEGRCEEFRFRSTQLKGQSSDILILFLTYMDRPRHECKPLLILKLFKGLQNYHIKDFFCAVKEIYFKKIFLNHKTISECYS